MLWAFHKVHHSAETLTPITVYRTHPVEGIIFATRAVFVQAVTIALFVSLFGGSIELVEVYGVNILLFIFNFTGANLRHSHIRIAYPRVIEQILISPAQHQIHHSSDVSHFNCNFGAALAIWDRVAKTLFTSESSQEITFGLIPEGSVVVSGSLPSEDGNYNLYCAVIVKKVDDRTRSKVSINEILREA